MQVSVKVVSGGLVPPLNGTFFQPPTVKVQWMDLGERSNEQYGGK